MSRSYTGLIPLPSNFGTQIEGPLDDRLVLDAEIDLQDKESIKYPYIGMVVHVKSVPYSLYTLLNIDYTKEKPFTWTKYNSIDNYVVETINGLSSIERPYIGMTVYVKETQSLWTLIGENIQDNWKEIKSGGAYFVEKISNLSNPDLRPYVGMLVHVHENPTSVYMYNGDSDWKEFRSIDNYVVETIEDLNNIESPYVGMFVHVKREPHNMYLYSYKTSDNGEIINDDSGNPICDWKVFKDYYITLGDVDLSEIQNQINDLKTEIENLKAPNLHVDLHNIDGTDLIRFTYDKSIKKSDSLTYDNTEHKLIFTTPEQETK